ncbi:hypothetical protein JOE57_002267 [Microlunatus panaciterrae]|uniref:Uncharacterized protein n=1 Tax=Microlunatus panaciterrae TaxID=400768 RepID=A0ABS2RK16_9ACTN|nr:hypothetical protein [Microlunatus panaciterrae]MBM7799346.1 hypothetical protein [Microlunatus panaciterrae]
MDPWIVGLIAVMVVGLAVIVFGALSDRGRNRRAAAEMLAPPKRVIPQFRPDAPAPHYLSELQARRPPADAPPTALTLSQRQKITQQLDATSTTRIGAGYASPAFVTDSAASWSVLDRPRVLICSDRVDSIRELLPVLEKLILSRTPLVVCAPSMSEEVLKTLEVNVIRRTMPLLAVVSEDAAVLRPVAGATGGVPVSHTDLQASFVPPDMLGSCERWVSSASTSFIITAPSASDTDDISSAE